MCYFSMHAINMVLQSIAIQSSELDAIVMASALIWICILLTYITTYAYVESMTGLTKAVISNKYIVYTNNFFSKWPFSHYF